MEEKIKLSSLLNICLNCKYQSENQDNFKELQVLMSQMQIRQYLPLTGKELAILSIISNMEQSSDFMDSEIRLEIGKIIFGLFSYITNFENDINFESLSLGVIDSLYELEVIDHILNFCQKDFDRLEKMLYNTLNFSNIEKIGQISESLSSEKIDEISSAIKDLKEGLTPEMIEAVKAISIDTSPEWKETQNMFKDILSRNLLEKELQTLEEQKKESNNNKEDKRVS